MRQRGRFSRKGQNSECVLSESCQSSSLFVCVSTVMSGDQAHAETPAGARQRRRSELEAYSASLASLKLSPMYPGEEEQQRAAGGMSSSAHYLEGTFNYTTNPDASNSSVDYYSVAPDLQVAPEPQDKPLQPLPNGSTSPLVFLPSSPQLSPFLGHPPAGQHTAQHVPYYLEPSATSIYRSETQDPRDLTFKRALYSVQPYTQCTAYSNVISATSSIL